MLKLLYKLAYFFWGGLEDYTIAQILSLVYFRTFEGVIDEPIKQGEYAFSYIDTRLDMFE